MEIISLAMITTLTLVCIFLVLYRYINDCKNIAAAPDMKLSPDAPGNLIWKLLGSFIPILHLFIIYREAKKLC